MRQMLMTIAIALLIAGTAFAQERAITPPPVVDEATAPAKAAEFDENSATTTIEALPADADKAAAASNLRPAMLEELRVVREQETTQVAELVAELENASSSQQFELQQRISEIKADAIQQSLTIQLEYAQLGGHADLAQRLETDLEQFEAQRNAPRGVINTTTVRDRQVPGGESR